MSEAYGVQWGARCSVIVGGECVAGNPNEGCEPLGNNNCMNHYRGLGGNAAFGVFIYSPSKKWLDAGVKEGDFLGSTSIAGALSTSEKIHNALAAPAGTVLLIERMVEGKRKRVEVTL